MTNPKKSNRIVAAVLIAILILLAIVLTVIWKPSEGQRATAEPVVLRADPHEVNRGPGAPTVNVQKKSMNNLKQIGLAAFMYASDAKGQMPHDLGQLLGPGHLSADVFLDPRRDSTLTREAVAMRGSEHAKWVNEHAEYLWFGAGLTDHSGRDAVLAAERPDGLTDGINVLYADGHVQYWEMDKARPILAAAQAALENRLATTTRPALEAQVK